ncbi:MULTISPECIES: ATP-binding protein [unclassified Streptomyces]|uniref:ATP-binding protein n=1 Tax=unclassified Streptomyces TaxID=2593676 RepID=UPI002E0F213E|nr:MULTISPECIES: ATP-binding protein [unclassified Streptomyces]WSR24149.1 ATP-binding protein [Streptomyces sp. NBC_01205]
MNTTGAAADDPRSAGAAVTGQRRRLSLLSVRGAVGKGRDFTRRTLREWGWDGHESAEDALLLVSELVTNAALHAGGCHELVLTAGEALRIDVLDGGASPPCPRVGRGPGVPGGHGLHIVQRLSDRWGSYTHGAGKGVWAEIEASRLEGRTPGPEAPSRG